jgi:Domain of unknown function (DUF4352)
MKTRATFWIACTAAGLPLGCSSAGSPGASDGGSGSKGSASSVVVGPGSGSGSSSGGSTDSWSTSDASSVATSLGVVLTVNSASSPSTLNGVSPPGGYDFFLVDLTLKNAGASEPLSTSFILFSLETSQALVISASSNQPSGACSATVSLAPGGQLECQVAFAVPFAQVPTTLRYDDLHGDEGSATVPAVATAGACEAVTGLVSKANPTCTQCVEVALGVVASGTAVAPCASQIAAYRSACIKDGDACSACGTNTDWCSCETSCDSTSCQALYTAEMSCVVEACSQSC